MKLLQNKYVWFTATIVLTIGYVNSCTKNDQVLNPSTGSAASSSTLISVKATTAPVIDGAIDASWDNATKLNVTSIVPDPGNGLFTGYSGASYPLTIRSMYDNQYIYFLVEVKDADKNLKGSTWYYNPTTKRWAQELNSKDFDQNGALRRDGFGIDQLAMLWNIDNSTPKFASQTCYASCHIFTPYVDYSSGTAVVKPNNSGNHYTNGASEKIDMWWAHPARGFAYGLMDDEYQDWAGGPLYTNLVGGSGNGRHLDDQVVNGNATTFPFGPTYSSDPTQGSANNRQTLSLNGVGTKVTVPMWIIPNSTADFIKVEDTLAGGAARKITGVDSVAGVLTFNGGTIDPNEGTDYQRTGDPVTGPTAAKAIPGVIVSPVKNGRADISLGAIYTGSGWVYEIKRLLKTPDALKQDIDFTKDKIGDQLADQPFGVAYFNRSNYQHGIKPNLLLKFKL
jgi:hypothetical protein